MPSIQEQLEALADHQAALKKGQDAKREWLNGTDNGVLDDNQTKPFKHTREQGQ